MNFKINSKMDFIRKLKGWKNNFFIFGLDIKKFEKSKIIKRSKTENTTYLHIPKKFLDDKIYSKKIKIKDLDGIIIVMV